MRTAILCSPPLASDCLRPYARPIPLQELAAMSLSIVMSEFKNVEDVKCAGEKVLDAVTRSRDIAITDSAGVCIYPQCASNLDGLL